MHLHRKMQTQKRENRMKYDESKRPEIQLIDPLYEPIIMYPLQKEDMPYCKYCSSKELKNYDDSNEFAKFQKGYRELIRKEIIKELSPEFDERIENIFYDHENFDKDNKILTLSDFLDSKKSIERQYRINSVEQKALEIMIPKEKHKLEIELSEKKMKLNILRTKSMNIIILEKHWFTKRTKRRILKRNAIKLKKIYQKSNIINLK